MVFKNLLINFLVIYFQFRTLLTMFVPTGISLPEFNLRGFRPIGYAPYTASLAAASSFFVSTRSKDIPSLDSLRFLNTGPFFQIG